MDRNQIINFFKEYRALECSCCSSLLGFQHRATGSIFCVNGCHERSPPPPSLPMMLSPNPLNHDGGTVTPTAAPMSLAILTTMSNALHAAAGGVPNTIVGYKQPVIMPIAARVPPTAEAVHPISSPKDVADPPLQEKAKVQQAAVKTIEVSSSLQKSIPATEKVLVAPPPPKSSLGFAEALAAASQSKNFPGPAEVRVEPSQTQLIQGSVDQRSMERPPPSIPVHVQVKAPPQWNDCTFSPNLLSPEAVVHVIYGWDNLTYHIMADVDEESVTKFQTLIAEYASEAKPLTRSPCLGEIVVAPYEGVHYRGKVDKVEGDNCTVTFVDYGDGQMMKISDVKPINDAIMKHPVYGMKVRLAKVQAPPNGFTMDERLKELIYYPGYFLDLDQNGDIKPADLSHFEARLWDLKKEDLLNEAINKAIVTYQ